MEWMLEMVNLTRSAINSLPERVAGDAKMANWIVWLSKAHYETELQAISSLLVSSSPSEEWLAIFGKRLKQIEIVYKRECWDLDSVRKAKVSLIQQKCKLYERQGKMELAQKLIREAMEKEKDPMLNSLHAELSLKTGQIEEALKAMEKYFAEVRLARAKRFAVESFRRLLGLVPVESRALFQELVPKYPHVSWAANSAGFMELSKEESKALRSQLEAKNELYCVNCSKTLSKIYRCSRCNIATYCGSACQKEAWKEHKKICKNKE
jgi:hypothetical protein